MLHHLPLSILWTQAFEESAIGLPHHATSAACHLRAFGLGLCSHALRELFELPELASMLRGGLGAIFALIIGGGVASMLEELVDFIHGLIDKALPQLGILLDIMMRR